MGDEWLTDLFGTQVE